LTNNQHGLVERSTCSRVGLIGCWPLDAIRGRLDLMNGIGMVTNLTTK
jgi:hypothetical protein